MLMSNNFINNASRNIARHKGYSIINKMGLSIGIAVCILLLLWVQDELRFDQSYIEKNSLYRIIRTGTSNQGEQYGNEIISYLLAPIIEDIILVNLKDEDQIYIINEDNLSSQNRLLLVEPALFDMFSLPKVKGDRSTPLENLYSLLITRNVAERDFDDEDPTGKVVSVNNKTDFTITGVVEYAPHNSTIDFDFIAVSIIPGKGRIEGWSRETFNNQLRIT